MKIKILTLLAIVALSLSIFYSCKKEDPTHPHPPTDSTNVADLRKGLLLYLPFNGSLADSSGNNNPVQAFAGGGLTYDEHGYANSAYNSPGNGSRLIVTNNGSIKFDTAYSISFSVMVRTARQQMYMSIVDYPTGHSPSFGLGTNYAITDHFGFTTNDITEACGTFGDRPSTQVKDTTSFIPQIESWYNIVCIYHRGTGSVYVNGKLVDTKISTGTLAKLCPDAQIVIGAWWASDPLSLDGKMDNVRIYNRVLLPEEIALLSTHYQPNSNSARQTASRQASSIGE